MWVACWPTIIRAAFSIVTRLEMCPVRHFPEDFWALTIMGTLWQVIGMR